MTPSITLLIMFAVVIGLAIVSKRIFIKHGR